MDKSLYELLTELCEMHINKKKYAFEGISIQPLVKKLRTNAYEHLLKKKITKEPKLVDDDSTPICRLLAWQFTLKNKLNQTEKADEIGRLIDQLKSSNILTDPVVNSVILFMMHLQNSDTHNSGINSNQSMIKQLKLKSSKTNIEYDQYTLDKFELPPSLKCNENEFVSNFDVRSFVTEPNLQLRLIKNADLNFSETYSSYKFPSLHSKEPTKDVFILKPNELCASSNIPDPVEVDDCVWEMARQLPLNHHKSWESLGVYDPIKELPFAMESGNQTLHKFQKIIQSNSLLRLRSEFIFYSPNYITSTQLIEDVKYMLVGMASKTFLTDDKDRFYLKRNICIEGLSFEALHSYCRDLTFSGSCYKGLQKLCSSHNYTNCGTLGYIFKELCKSVKRYLLHYRVVALSVPVTSGLLAIHKHLRSIKDQIGTLARLCKVGPFASPKDEEDMPSGADLLTYLYQEIIKVTDRDLQLILYSAFYPCCQIYFRRFLQCWLFEGIVMDPFEEFLIKVDTNYSNAHSRIYWTRCFSLKTNSIPNFLVDLRNDILLCGKTINLLKLCKPDNPLCTYVVGKSIPIISCCLTSKQFEESKREFSCYYIDAALQCGPRIPLVQTLQERTEENLQFLSLVEQKRVLTLRKIELERRKAAQEAAKKKQLILEELKEQMRLTAEYKRKEKAEELRRDLIIAEQNAKMEEMRSKLVNAEANNIINYYNSLMESADKRKASIDKYTQEIKDKGIFSKSVEAKPKPIERIVEVDEDIEENVNDNVGEESNDDVDEELNENVDEESNDNESVTPKVEELNLDTVENLDLLNANTEETVPSAVKLNNQINEAYLAEQTRTKVMTDAHSEAQRNRAKVLNLEFGVEVKETSKSKHKQVLESNDNLTEAQRNKLKVLSSEFDILTGVITQKSKANDNENSETISDLTNLASPGEELVMNTNHKRKLLSLPNKLAMTDNSENVSETRNLNININIDVGSGLSEVTPMSVDSTPMTELSTPCSSKMFLSTENMLDTAGTLDSALTVSSCITDDGFKFPEPNKFVYENPMELTFANKKIFSITEHIPESEKPMKLSKEEVDGISSSHLKLLLHQSVLVPLEAQIKLVNNEILKYYIVDQEFFSHLHSLRCYYFLLDGEFGRRITEGLFNKLYEVRNPVDMLNCRSLQLIMSKALFASSKIHKNAERLSFTIQNIPKSFNLNNIDVLDCLSMSYRVNWPLNILLPSDTVEKYELVFKYLLKLHHVSWILQKIFQDLKNSQKVSEASESKLLRSPQYHQVQLYRHVMMHFIQTLQNYTISEVLQTSWDELERNMQSVTTLDQLYSVHIIYVKTIIFRCLLNKKCSPIMKVIHEIFMVILKFYNYLKARTWILKDGTEHFMHPNFRKLTDIFHKFEEFTNFVFRVGNKMARVGYQPHLMQMLDMLNMNSYYTKKLNI